MLSRTLIFRTTALFAGCMWACAPAMAQEAGETAPVAEPATCELHVWPSPGLGSVYTGWFHGGIVNGAVTGRDGYDKVPPDPMRVEAQVALLEAAQPQTMLGLTPHRLIVHPESLPSSVIRSTPGRIAAGAAPCYAELIVDDVIYQKDPVNGGSLKTLFRFRDFGTAEAPVRSFGSFVKTDLLRFPPKTAADFDSAVAEVERAYRANIGLFAAALNKPAKSKKK